MVLHFMYSLRLIRTRIRHGLSAASRPPRFYSLPERLAAASCKILVHSWSASTSSSIESRMSCDRSSAASAATISRSGIVNIVPPQRFAVFCAIIRSFRTSACTFLVLAAVESFHGRSMYPEPASTMRAHEGTQNTVTGQTAYLSSCWIRIGSTP